MASNMLKREETVEFLDRDYPNLVAILKGCVSGNVTEWPMMRPELVRLVSMIAEQRQVIEVQQKTNEYLGETIRKWETICQGQQETISQQEQEITRLKRDSLNGQFDYTALRDNFDTQTQTIQVLREALRSLRNNVAGAIGIAEDEIRAAIGNTNTACMKHNVDQAQRVLEETNQ